MPGDSRVQDSKPIFITDISELVTQLESETDLIFDSCTGAHDVTLKSVHLNLQSKPDSCAAPNVEGRDVESMRVSKERRQSSPIWYNHHIPIHASDKVCKILQEVLSFLDLKVILSANLSQYKSHLLPKDRQSPNINIITASWSLSEELVRGHNSIRREKPGSPALTAKG
ncbi:hypothetical protein Q9966_000325 [Columba livia]|nr:hypothetical protein Q9966_000325 [Columba livia]